MNISEKIKEMQADFDKYHGIEKDEHKEEYKLENMLMLILSDGGYLGPGKIIGESEEYLDFMFYKRNGPTFSLSMKKDHICGVSILHKFFDKDVLEMEDEGISKALYQ